jgi:RNA polymerase sigma-70 factor (ECF subfamily)
MTVDAGSRAIEAEQERSVCQRYSNRIRSYGLCHLRDGAGAEDLVQQVLLIVLQALRDGRVNDVGNLDKYVFGTCRNTVLDMRRGGVRERRIANAAAAMLPAGYEAPRELADRSPLDQCLEQLESRARTVALATFVDERDAVDVGRSMSLSAGNVRVIRHRAFAHLQRCMDGGVQA